MHECLRWMHVSSIFTLKEMNVFFVFYMISRYWNDADNKGQPRSWWRYQMETFSALLVICAGNSPVTGEFPTQRPVTRSYDVYFDLHLNKRLSKQSWGWWVETQSRSLWRHCNVKSRPPPPVIVGSGCSVVNHTMAIIPYSISIKN